MSAPDLIFVGWWYASGLVLGSAAWAAARRGRRVNYEIALKVMLVGIAAGLTLYLVPNGVASIDSPTDFKLRLLAALGVAWAAAALMSRSRPQTEGRSAIALAAFIGINVPPLALVLSATMVCGGHPSCL